MGREAGRCIWIAYLLLATPHVAMLACQSFWNSPTRNEPAHLAAGISHWYFQRFDLYRVNPPLVRSVAAMAVLPASPKTQWGQYSFDATVRRESGVGQVFMLENGARSLWLVSIARLACIPFSLLGGWTCGIWARRLFGTASGVIAMALWFFSPTILGHGSLLTPDAGSASMGVAAMYTVWRWVTRPTRTDALLAGTTLGIAELTKFTLLSFYPTTICLWIVYRWGRNQSSLGDNGETAYRPTLGQLMIVLLASLFVINLGYGCEGTLKRMGDFHFRSSLLTGTEKTLSSAEDSGNRFADTPLAGFPVPLPANYVQGIDTQRIDLERGVGSSYICGTWKETGWWYWYLCAMAFKTPLGTIAIFLLAVTSTLLMKHYNASFRDELAVILPAVAVFVLVSSQTGFTIHYRYVMPALPFFFIWVSKPAQAITKCHWTIAIPVLMLIVGAVIESVSVFPHCLSFFNQAAGGPKNGHHYLVNSNIAWGQDLLYFHRWRKLHPEAGPWHLAYFGSTHPHLLDIDFRMPPTAPHNVTATDEPIDLSRCGPQPGWYAIDINYLYAVSETAAESNGGWTTIGGEKGDLHYFLQFEPIASAGYSIYIYHITLDDANHVRRKLGLPELLPDTGRRCEDSSILGSTARRN